MSLLNRPINLTVLSTTKSTVSREVITAGDSGAYPLTITFSDVDAITGGVKFHFVRGDDYWDRDASDGIAISGNSVSYMLEPVLYAKPGLTLWVSFDNSNLFTPLQVTFNNIRTIPGTVEAATTQPYPQWAADMRAFDVSIGTVETLAEGEDATASVTGDVPGKTLNLGIPVGATGATGEKGNTGEIAVGTVTTLAAGADATVTNTGTSTDAVLDFGIPQGIQGDAATVEVGTVTTVSPSTPASVTNVGTASEAVLDFSIPKGDTGAAGTINETTESTLDGILAADGSTVAVASAAQAAAQAMTDPGDLYTADNIGGQLQEVKALADDKAGNVLISDNTFNADWLSGTWAADADTDTLTCSIAHGLTTGTHVSFGSGTGVLPGGIATEPDFYFVESVPTPTTLKIKATYNGTAINITDNGTMGWQIRPARVSAYATYDLEEYNECDIYGIGNLLPYADNGRAYLALVFTVGSYVFLNDPNVYGVDRNALLYSAVTTNKYTKLAMHIHLRKIESGLYLIQIDVGGISSNNLSYSSGVAYTRVFSGIITGGNLTSVNLTSGYIQGLMTGARVILIGR